MSNFLLGLVGAAIGSAFGMPALGFALGSAVGVSHHRSNSPAPGRSLNDLKVQTATYGIGIPCVYGRYRLAGNILWAKDILEVKGNKDHYNYYGSFAIGLCKGPVAGIRRIWAEDKEIFNDAFFLGQSLCSHDWPGIRFYPGDEKQVPDPLIEAFYGKGQVPAFRGLAYLVFENLPLADFNNRLPSIRVEVIQSVSEREPRPEESRQKAYNEQKALLQNGARLHSKPGQSQPSLSTGALIKAPAPVPLSEVVTDLCRQVGFTSEQLNTHLLNATLLGFVALPPMSARDVLASLMQVYDFDLVEVGKHLVCIPQGQGSLVPISEGDLAQEDNGDVFGVRIRRLPPSDCLQSLALLFNEAQQYTLTTQRAQSGFGQRSERLELPLLLTREEAAVRVSTMLEQATVSLMEYSFSLPRTYASLTPSDRLQWQGQVLRVVRVAYGSPGLVQVQAIEEREGNGPAFEEAGKVH